MSVSWRKYKELILDKDIIIGIFVILLIVWSLFYLIPGILVLLFNSFLGILLIILATIIIALKNYKIGIVFGIISLILVRMTSLAKNPKEGFTWKEEDRKNYITIQQTKNPGIVFDTSIMENQINNEELSYYFENGYWPWSKRTEELYTEAINNNPIIRQYSKDSIESTKTIYNEEAILQILGQQSKEGQFLINGVEIELEKKSDPNDGWGNYAYNSGQLKHKRPIIKCSMDNNNVLKQITPKGMDPVLGSEITETSNVDLNNLEKIIPGFKYLKGKCNPCSNISSIPEYNCPFELKIRDNEGPTSSIWEYLWFGK